MTIEQKAIAAALMLAQNVAGYKEVWLMYMGQAKRIFRLDRVAREKRNARESRIEEQQNGHKAWGY